MAHVPPFFCPSCLGFATGVWGDCGCPGPRCRVLPLWESSAQPDLPSLMCFQQALSASQSQPLCHVSWHCTLKVNLLHAVNYQAQQSQRSPHHSELAAEVWFVLLCLHFYCPLTFYFPFFSVLCRVLPLPLSPVCCVPVFPFLSSPSLLLPCRVRRVFPFTLPFLEPSHLLCCFLFPSPWTLWGSLPESLRATCVPLCFREWL